MPKANNCKVSEIGGYFSPEQTVTRLEKWHRAHFLRVALRF